MRLARAEEPSGRGGAGGGGEAADRRHHQGGGPGWPQLVVELMKLIMPWKGRLALTFCLGVLAWSRSSASAC